MSAAEEPTVAAVLARLDVISLELRAGLAEVRLSTVELRGSIAELRADLRAVDEGLRSLWTEHWSHSHPEEGS